MIREVYYNLNRHVYSIRAKKCPVTYAKNVMVTNPKFVVRPAGRAAVLRDRQKNVHAFIKGELWEIETRPMIDGLKRVRYDPYYAGHFYDVLTDEPIHQAETAILFLDENSRPHVYIKE